VYDFSNLVSNIGQQVTTAGLTDKEGIVVITPVETCDIIDVKFDAVSWNFMQGNVRIINETQDWEYGTNVRARTAAPAEPYQDPPEDNMGNGNVYRNFVWDYYAAVDPSTCDDGPCPAGKLFKDFDQVGTNTGSDLVLISFGDYGLCGDDSSSNSCCSDNPRSFNSICEGDDDDDEPKVVQNNNDGASFGSPGTYNPAAAPTSTFGPFGIFDANEVGESCPAIQGCFRRIGIDFGIPSTDDIEPTPPIPTCDFIDGEPNCANPLCKQFVGCENFAEGSDPGICEDGLDNDGEDGTDCADFGCDGFVIDEESGAQCEAGGETSCADGFDNDNNTFIDCDDPNCVLTPVCESGTDSGGGGCTVAAGPVTSGSSAANFLLPLLPLAGVFAVRRIIRRRRK